MLSGSLEIEVAASQDEVWLQLVNIERYGLWSPSVMHVEIPASAPTLLSSPVKFTLNTLSGRQIRQGRVEELSAPNRLYFSFTRPYSWWLSESWCFNLSSDKRGNTKLEVELKYNGWMKTRAFHFEYLLTKALLEAHLIALKETLETLDYDDSLDDMNFMP
ncbi:hypothetical protein MED121_12100 [Marinomonas sp. MED121]|uniref:hypothetical protein n=1 Tax=Marinomonas sp. MED121 TaxID=314277 RepID=UPI000068FFB0|nr:hypothetical protein [Marinomonas sp. MED121]EAQ66666.1 hypothetical protein MED121_12100 [Marinomonas sp. MED121]